MAPHTLETKVLIREISNSFFKQSLPIYHVDKKHPLPVQALFPKAGYIILNQYIISYLNLYHIYISKICIMIDERVRDSTCN